MKKIFYFLSLLAALTACGEKAEEKTFLNKSVNQFLEYDKIAQSTPRINLSNILSKISEFKLSLINNKLSKDCKGSVDYFVKNIATIQDAYNKFLEKGDDTDDMVEANEARDTIKVILSYNSCKDVMEMVNKKQQEHDFFQALGKKESDIQHISKYITKGVDVNAKDTYKDTPLMLASNSDNLKIVEIVKTLIDNGADINAENITGSTSLMFAVNNENPQAFDVVKLLVKKGANVNAVNKYGSTVLMLAVASKNPQALDIVKLLIDKDADINAKNEIDDQTVLMTALKGKGNQSLDIIKYLIEKGTNLNIQSFDNVSIIDVSQDALRLYFVYGWVNHLFKFQLKTINLQRSHAKRVSILKIAMNSEHPQKNEIIKLLKLHGAK